MRRTLLVNGFPGRKRVQQYRCIGRVGLGDQPIDNIPTGGICCMDLKITSWKGIQEHGGKLRFFEFPKNHAS
jgi:hypothetical protein